MQQTLCEIRNIPIGRINRDSLPPTPGFEIVSDKNSRYFCWDYGWYLFIIVAVPEVIIYITEMREVKYC